MAAEEKPEQSAQPTFQEPEQRTLGTDTRQQTEQSQQQVEPPSGSTMAALQRFLDDNAVGTGIAGLLFLAFIFFVAARWVRRLLSAARGLVAEKARFRVTYREAGPFGGFLIVALGVWFFGPFVDIAGWVPLQSVTARAATIAFVFLTTLVAVLRSPHLGRGREDPEADIARKGAAKDDEVTPGPRLEESIADRLISDRPLEPGDPDPLGFGAIARGISRFLRNEKTEPPLTMAINGPWGSGKSSIMNLLRADMQRYDYRPVWFNAWHHQKEEHLLAALLETLRVSGFPPIWTRHGLYFRSHLFWNRTRRQPALLLLIGGLIAVQAGLALAGALDETAELLKSGWTFAPGLAAIATFLLTLHTRFRNTLLDPSRLASQVAGGFRVGRFRDKLSFRHRFQSEFRDVAEAMKPLRMVILIDDLDRCRPSNVLAALEAVNFLATSGDCFIIMGLDRERVLDCVGHGFKEVAEDLIESHKDGGIAEELDALAKRRAFAEQYLEKLINIEVSVPPLEDTGAEALLESAVDKPTKQPLPASPRPAAPERTWARAFAGFVAVGALAFLFGKVYVGDWSIGADEAQQAGGFQGPETETLWQIENLEAWIVMVGLGLLVAFGLAAASAAAGFRRRLEVIGAMTEDSADFNRALAIWRPLIVSRFHTPRALKRFLNRLRYLAMCSRREKNDGEPQDAETIDETTLVALATANLCLPAGLDDMPVELWSQDEAPPSDGQEAAARSKQNGALAGIIQAHRESFAGRKPSEQIYERFARIASGVRVN